jgi:predicted phage terminase large subunit-like protein
MPELADLQAFVESPEGQKALLVSSLRYCVTKVFGYVIAEHHERIIRHLEDRQATLDLCPRGSGKTRIGTIGYAAWRALQNPDLRILIVSDTDDHAVRFLGTIKSAFESSPLVTAAFGKLEGEKWTDHEITLAGRTAILTEATITALGMYSGAVTSGHYDIIIADDLVNFKNSRTEGLRNTAKEWFRSTLLPTLIPGGEIHVLGTRYHYLDLYQMVIDELGYDTLVQPAIVVDEEGRERSIWEAYMPLEDRTGPDGKTTDGLRTVREDLGSVHFGLQYQNDVALLKEGEIFHYEWFRYYDVEHDDEGEAWAVCDDGYRVRVRDLAKFGGVDPATSKRDTADFFTFAVNGVERGVSPKLRRYFLLDMVRGKFTLQKRRQIVRDKAAQWDLRVTGIEDNGAQEDFVTGVREEHPSIRIQAVTTVNDKVSRAYNRAGIVEAGKVFVRRSMAGFVEELVAMPDGEHDDQFDSWDMALFVSRMSGAAVLTARPLPGGKTYR